MVSDSQEAAEAECSEHVVEAICAAFDREFSNSAKIVNAALQDFLAAASNTQKEQWRAVHFRTLVDSVCITRDSLGSTQFAALPDGAGRFQPPVVLRIPRDALGIKHLLAGVQLLQPAHQTATPPNAAAPLLRSAVSWQDKTVTVTVDYDRTVGLAQEPAIGAGQ